MNRTDIIDLLQELLSSHELSELAIRIAGLSLIAHYKAEQRGEHYETAADIQWAIDKAKELGCWDGDAAPTRPGESVTGQIGE